MLFELSYRVYFSAVISFGIELLGAARYFEMGAKLVLVDGIATSSLVPSARGEIIIHRLNSAIVYVVE